VYPIVLQHLFRQFGFPWAVRICGISSTLLCGVATVMVSSPPSQKKLGPVLGISIIKDTKFLFLSAGSCFVALGTAPVFCYSPGITQPFSKDYLYHFSISLTIRNI
jgi:hypothetical protein